LGEICILSVLRRGGEEVRGKRPTEDRMKGGKMAESGEAKRVGQDRKEGVRGLGV